MGPPLLPLEPCSMSPLVAFRHFAWGNWGLLGMMPTCGASHESSATALLTHCMETALLEDALQLLGLLPRLPPPLWLLSKGPG